MKLFRNILIATSALALAAACQPAQEEGKGDATIGFDSPTYVYKESAGRVKLQVKFEGEPKTYPISFDVVASVTTAEEGIELEDLVHFTQTEGLKYVGNPDAPAYIEFDIKDNDFINDSRFITLELSNVKGAEIVGDGKTVIELADNDNNPYERLMGNWILSGTSPFDGSTATTEVNISGGFSTDEENVNFEKKLVCWGIANTQKEISNGSPLKQPVWYLAYDGDSKLLTLQTGTLMANAFSFGIGDNEEVYMAALYVNAEGKLVYSLDYNGVTATWSDDMNTITFVKNTGIFAAIYSNGEDTGYGWDGYINITMTRK